MVRERRLCNEGQSSAGPLVGESQDAAEIVAPTSSSDSDSRNGESRFVLHEPHDPIPYSLNDLSSIERIKDHLRWWYERSTLCGDPLPEDLAEPGPLIARVVQFAGDKGIARQRLFEIFHLLRAEQVEQGIATALDDGRVLRHVETRPDSSGRTQPQMVYRYRLDVSSHPMAHRS